MKLILEEETFEKFGYYSKDLKKYSNKKIITKCGKCGKVREVRKKDYRNLCYSCSIKRKERGQKIGIAHIGNHHSNKSKLKMHEVKIGKYMGDKNPAWKGGISFEPYCVLFTKEFKERVRKYWNRKCVLCNKTESENGRKLNVHHVTYNKESCCDDTIPLFVALCDSCHLKTNTNREYWKNEFKRIIYSKNINGKCFYIKNESE